ncbi:hypothetical protein [Streptomyces xanthophaeus]|uniref:hypothetical protein n=1 Tax=Streptomyces xanthophaeus TaxID=67385 RepID=UPI00233F5C8C|nr:hypothetical protein [Streptomyces xanthophaeus]
MAPESRADDPAPVVGRPCSLLTLDRHPPRAAGTVEDFLPRVPAEEESTDFHIRRPAAADASVRVHLAVREVPEQGACRYRSVAGATRPWDWSWSSPLALFAPPTLLWDVCDQSTAGRFGHPNWVPATGRFLDRLHGLRDAWSLESERERLDRVLAALADQRLCMGALTAQYAGQRALADTRKVDLDDALKAAREAEDRERTAVEQLRDVQTRLADLAESVRSGALLVAVRAADERREASERDVEAAEELLDAQTEEILRLRTQLTATPHRVPVPVPAQRAPVPSGWEELADRARHSFARLLLADITETIRPPARPFPVPRTIHPAGQVFMGEHVRIGSGRPPAPRLHLYDDTSGRTGQIHIGYIGAHLP